MTARPVRGKVRWEALDPFELPETLGTEEVVWEAVDAIASGPVVRGLLEAGADTTLACDLLAVDEAKVPRREATCRVLAQEVAALGLAHEERGRPLALQRRAAQSDQLEPAVVALLAGGAGRRGGGSPRRLSFAPTHQACSAVVC